MTKIFDICSKRIYEKNGETKVKFQRIGVLRMSEAGRIYIQLYIFPQTDFYVFEKDSQPEVKTAE